MWDVAQNRCIVTQELWPAAFGSGLGLREGRGYFSIHPGILTGASRGLARGQHRGPGRAQGRCVYGGPGPRTGK